MVHGLRRRKPEGVAISRYFSLQTVFEKSQIFLFPDFALATVVMIDESLPPEWFNRRGFINARMFLLFIWLFVGNVLSMGYRTVFILIE